MSRAFRGVFEVVPKPKNGTFFIPIRAYDPLIKAISIITIHRADAVEKFDFNRGNTRSGAIVLADPPRSIRS